MVESVSRRAFLAAGAGAVALAACGGGQNVGDVASSPTGAASGNAAFNLVEIFASDALVPGAPQRLSYALADAQGAMLDQPPRTLDFTVLDAEGAPLGPATTVTAHNQGLPRAYYPVTFTPTAAGIYQVQTTVEGNQVTDTLQIEAASAVLQPGQPMIPFDTPTVSDPEGVELLCTRSPQCPLHDVTLTEALGEGRPVAFLIATPLYCQVGICGPVLDVLLALTDAFSQVRFLHSEVYPTTAAAESATDVVPVITAYHLSYEPALFLARADGTLAERLDTIFDEVELREALTRLVS